MKTCWTPYLCRSSVVCCRSGVVASSLWSASAKQYHLIKKMIERNPGIRLGK